MTKDEGNIETGIALALSPKRAGLSALDKAVLTRKQSELSADILQVSFELMVSGSGRSRFTVLDGTNVALPKEELQSGDKVVLFERCLCGCYTVDEALHELVSARDEIVTHLALYTALRNTDAGRSLIVQVRVDWRGLTVVPEEVPCEYLDLLEESPAATARSTGRGTSNIN